MTEGRGNKAVGLLIHTLTKRFALLLQEPTEIIFCCHNISVDKDDNIDV